MPGQGQQVVPVATRSSGSAISESCWPLMKLRVAPGDLPRCTPLTLLLLDHPSRTPGRREGFHFAPVFNHARLGSNGDISLLWVPRRRYSQPLTES
jgi:hypothetical protein